MPAEASASTSFIRESTFPRFHALDGGEREAGALGKLALVDAQQRPRGPHLRPSDHVSDIRIDVDYVPIHA
jgi:hypothetical protein